jgi:phenylalanyl-tRNA synthetase alpha chain
VQQSIEELREQFLQQLAQVQTTHDLENLRVKFLGKKGPIQQLMQVLRDVTPAQRPLVGKQINDLKEFMTLQCDRLESELTSREEEQQLAHEKIDITLPGRRRSIGRKHPLTQAMDQIISILSSLGFSVQYGPDIDTDYYNFEVLNFPPDHPARDMQDTFYISPGILLRTHTSNIQARVMEVNKPPIRIIAPGKVYRNETITARSHVFFHQVEAVYIDKHVTFADLFATLDDFLAKLFKQPIATRYRPSYFPFVEPGVEVDISCLVCQGKGCPLCKYSGWVEIAGAGMIHPEVLSNGGIDPEQYTGFAWGMGLERMVMMLRGIQDIRLFTENDLRFLSQFTAL